MHYGDSRRGELLTAVGLQRARLLVVAVDQTDVAMEVLKAARRINAQVPILVRTRDDSQHAELKAAGATEVVPELLESSLMLASHALIMLGVPERQVQAKVDEVRHNRYRLLHGFYHGTQANLLDSQGQSKTLMHAVNLSDAAHACGQTLNTLELESMGVEVQGLQRNGQELAVEDSGVLQPGDTVLISGPLPAIEACESRLLSGQ